MIPDHTPQMTCDAPWHAGMAYAMGYMKAAMKLVGVDCGPCRLPQMQLTHQQESELFERLEKIGFNDYCSTMPTAEATAA